MNVLMVLTVVLIHAQILLVVTHALVGRAIIWQVMDGHAMVRFSTIDGDNLEGESFHKLTIAILWLSFFRYQ